VREHTGPAAGAVGRDPAAATEHPGGVVALALLPRRRGCRRRLHLLELVLGAAVVRVAVRVVLPRELAVSLLDLVLARRLLDAEHLVQALRHSDVLRRRDDDARRPQHLVAQEVALLEHLDHVALVGVRGLCEQRLVAVRVEGPVDLDLGQTLTLERAREGPVDEADALLELRLLVLAGSLERTLEVVQDREQLGDKPLVGARDQSLLVAHGPLAVVVEVGRGRA